MDFVQEAVFLGVDVLILGLCFKEYYQFKKISSALKVRASHHSDFDRRRLCHQ